jgi:ferredoxin-NADP reductase
VGVPVTAPVVAGPDALVVTTLERVADDVLAVEFAHPDGGTLPTWTPGAHIDVLLPVGAADPVVRQYSLCGEPEQADRWRIAVLREPAGRGGSSYVHDHLRVGHVLSYRGPRNHFPLGEASRYVFVAGGIGITPIMAMARAAEEQGRAWDLTYAVRSRGRLAFVDELLALGGGRIRLHVENEHGLLDLDALVASCTPGTAVYACGPGGLLAALEERHEAVGGWDLHVERFVAALPPIAAVETGFEVELASSGRRLFVPVGRSVLSVLEDNGVDVMWSCGEGTCGTCETGVLQGAPDHRDVVLTREERAAGDLFMPCVSRSMSPLLVLDL